MEPNKRPRLHGRDHLPGGADPIPGLSVAGVGGDWASAVTALPDLRGFWRMGDGTGGGGTFADIAGFPGGPFDMTEIDGSVYNFLYGQTGLLPPAQDDGALHAQGSFTHSSGVIDDIRTTDSAILAGTAANLSVGAWIKPDALGADAQGGIVNCCSLTGSPEKLRGWSLDMTWTGGAGGTLTLRWRRTDGTTVDSAESVVTAGDAIFVMGTFDGTDIKLYINGTLAATQSSGASFGDNPGSIRVGAVDYEDVSFGGSAAAFNGIIDEVTFWGACKTAGEVAVLYDAGISASDEAGKVLTVESEGVTQFQWPHMRVLASDPTADNPGEFYLNSGDSSFRVWNGSAWVKTTLS